MCYEWQHLTIGITWYKQRRADCSYSFVRLASPQAKRLTMSDLLLAI